MDIIWKLEPGEREKLREFIASHQDNAFVRYRIRNNIKSPPTSVSLEMFWERLVGALLTSQQRSGPDSHVARFLRHEPFLLSFDFCKAQSDIENATKRILETFGGIRFKNRIAEFLARNFDTLCSGLWNETKDVLEELILRDSPERERRATKFLREHFIGLGPKQSRNLLQGLGLTRYEIPIDSRITKWLNQFGFPVHLSAAGLSDPHYYNFVSEGVQAMCRTCDIFPCVFDAAVFSSYDDGWTEDNVVW